MADPTPIPTQESALSILRERTLSFWLQATQQKPDVKARLFQGTTIEGTFVATDSESNRFRINNLQTPIGIYECAVIRGTDVDVVEVKLGDEIRLLRCSFAAFQASQSHDAISHQMASSLTSLTVNKGNTRFAPTVKPRANRKPATPAETTPKPVVPAATTIAAEIIVTEPLPPVVEKENALRLSAATPQPPAIVSTSAMITKINKGKAPEVTSATIIKPSIDKGKGRAVPPAITRQEKTTPNGSSSKPSPPSAPTAAISKRKGKAKAKSTTSRSKGIVASDPSTSTDPAAGSSTLTTPKRRGKAIATPINNLDAPTADTESVASSTAGGRRRAPRKRKEQEPTPMLTLEEVPNPTRAEYLDRPISDFTRDLGEGVVSKAYKEFEEQRLRKRKEMMETIKGMVETTEEMNKAKEETRRGKKKKKENENVEAESSVAAGKRKANEVREEGVDSGGPAEKRPKSKESAFAPQVRMVNGKIVLDEESLLIDRSAMAQDENEGPMEYVEETAMTRLVNSVTHSKRVRTEKWSEAETELFYEALTQWGTDFNIISKLFPNRTRRQIKAKYNKEDRARRWKVSEAIMVNRRTPDMEKYTELTGRTFMENPPIDDVAQDAQEARQEEARQEEASVATQFSTVPSGGQQELEEEIVGTIDDEEIIGMIKY
ncbi:hypothetical protein BC937DRAFT_88496 [Endogone sp. FLAS-F59071]|nr:hypothetical protein BC937DRAFT_88496 [Endogone sp. FLAS-F59071]|eukprot:RUS18647.1 hypothetical protein BC937DRAFT_88496 [Endogone sp. FLAS-F59071]